MSYKEELNCRLDDPSEIQSLLEEFGNFKADAKKMVGATMRKLEERIQHVSEEQRQALIHALYADLLITYKAGDPNFWEPRIEELLDRVEFFFDPSVDMRLHHH